MLPAHLAGRASLEAGSMRMAFEAGAIERAENE